MTLKHNRSPNTQTNNYWWKVDQRYHFHAREDCIAVDICPLANDFVIAREDCIAVDICPLANDLVIAREDCFVATHRRTVRQSRIPLSPRIRRRLSPRIRRRLSPAPCSTLRRRRRARFSRSGPSPPAPRAAGCRTAPAICARWRRASRRCTAPSVGCRCRGRSTTRPAGQDGRTPASRSPRSCDAQGRAASCRNSRDISL